MIGDLDSLISFCGWACLTFTWLKVNMAFFGAIDQAIQRHKDEIREKERRCKQALREKAYNEGFANGRNCHIMLDNEEDESFTPSIPTMSDKEVELKKLREDFTSMMLGHQLLNEDPQDLLKTLADGIALFQRAQRFQTLSGEDNDAHNIFGIYWNLSELLKYLIDITYEIQGPFRENWKDCRIRAFPEKFNEFIALDKEIISWRQASIEKSDKLSAKLNTTS